MNHIDCRQARDRLGVSANDMARLLGVTDGRAVRRFEADPAESATARAPQGPLAVLYRLILDGRVDRAALAAARWDSVR